MIYRVGEMLRLQAEGFVLLVNLAAFALEAPVEKVAAVELDPGLIGENFQHSAAAGIVCARSEGR